jgi:hypothetical protein
MPNPSQPTSPPAPLGHFTVQTQGGSLNVRAQPSTSASIGQQIANGAAVTAYGRNAAWYCLSPNGDQWVAAQFLEPVSANGAPAPAPAGPLSATSASDPAAQPGPVGPTGPLSPAHIAQVDTLYEVYYNDLEHRQASRDVPLYQLDFADGPNGASRASYFHRGSMQVDVDGSPRAYYPDNASPLRLDDVSDADSEGGSTTYIQGDPPGIGPDPGFYVSATSLRRSEERMFDCANFPDAERIPFFIHPPGRNGVNLGDVGVIVHIPTMRWTEAIFGDTNDHRRVSEASLRVAVNLGQSTIDADGRVHGLSADNGDDQRHYFYLYFPNSALTPAPNPPYWPESAIYDQVRPLFAAWGGLARVRQCLNHI